jgi:hypothetical protein
VRLGGRRELALDVVTEEIETRLRAKGALQPADLTWAAQAMEDLLTAMEECVIQSVISGNISLDKRRNPALAKALADIRPQSKEQPSIYHQSMNNKKGLSPTPNQLLEALDHMESYVKATCEKNHPDDVKEYTKVKALSRQELNDIDQFKGFVRKKLDLAWGEQGAIRQVHVA